MTRRRRATAPPLRLRLRSGTAARREISYEPKDRKPDGGWGHFKRPRRGQCKRPQRAPSLDEPGSTPVAVNWDERVESWEQVAASPAFARLAQLVIDFHLWKREHLQKKDPQDGIDLKK